jgi:hypothetical protein
MRKLFFFGTALVAVLVCAPLIWSQDATGNIDGVITDASGAVVPGATVVVTNLGTKISKQTTTDSQGFYQVLQLPIGSYEVSAEASGFSKTIMRPRNSLEINATLRVDMMLEVGTTATSVTVEGRAGNVETGNSTVGGTVTGEAIYELPLNGRDTLDLLATQPGVTQSNPDSGAAGSYSIGGGRTDSVTYLLDGGLNNDLIDNSVVVDPNPDAVAEFRVLESTYAAEYGRNAGGIVSVVTKSGTNQLHGTAYDYARNTAFDANDFFNNEQGLPTSVLRRHQYGATLGGPIVIPHIVNGRNKLFFFFAYQGQQQTQLQLEGKVPTYTPAEAMGNFSQAVDGGPDPAVAAFLEANPYYQPNPTLAAQAIINPSSIDPVAQAYFKNGLIPTSPTGYLFPTAPAILNNNEYLGKADYMASSRDTISATFTSRDTYETNPYANSGAGQLTVNGYNTATYLQTSSAIINYSHVFTPSLLNEARVSVVRSDTDQYVPNTSFSQVNPSNLGVNITPDLLTGPPGLYFYGTGLNIGFAPYGPTTFYNTIDA